MGNRGHCNICKKNFNNSLKKAITFYNYEEDYDPFISLYPFIITCKDTRTNINLCKECASIYEEQIKNKNLKNKITFLNAELLKFKTNIYLNNKELIEYEIGCKLKEERAQIKNDQEIANKWKEDKSLYLQANNLAGAKSMINRNINDLEFLHKYFAESKNDDETTYFYLTRELVKRFKNHFLKTS